MKILKDPISWLSLVLVITGTMLYLQCSSNLRVALEETHKELIEKRKEFMEQCQQDGYSKTDCQIKYQEI